MPKELDLDIEELISLPLAGPVPVGATPAAAPAPEPVEAEVTPAPESASPRISYQLFARALGRQAYLRKGFEEWAKAHKLRSMTRLEWEAALARYEGAKV